MILVFCLLIVWVFVGIMVSFILIVTSDLSEVFLKSKTSNQGICRIDTSAQGRFLKPFAWVLSILSILFFLLFILLILVFRGLNSILKIL